MSSHEFAQRRSLIEAYFDRTAFEAWRQLTSDAPVSKIRATVRAGRERMRSMMLSWLPTDLDGATLLDAGCGTGAFSVELARRGASVVAIDVSANLVGIAEERVPSYLGGGAIQFRVGDMLDPGPESFDHVVAMDSLIHYETKDILAALARLASRTRHSILFTVAPRTTLLNIMWGMGKMFPRGDRAPAIVPQPIKQLACLIETDPAMQGWTVARTQRIVAGFYTSQAIHLVRQ